VSGQDQLRAPGECLWGIMGLDQLLESTHLIGNELKRTLGEMKTHGVPRFLDRLPLRMSHSLSRTHHSQLYIPGECLLFGTSSDDANDKQDEREYVDWPNEAHLVFDNTAIFC